MSESYKHPHRSLGTPAAEGLVSTSAAEGGQGAQGWHGHCGLSYGTNLHHQPLPQLSRSHLSPAVLRHVEWERKSIPEPI